MRARALRQDVRSRTWAIAWLLTLALHVLIFIGLQAGPRWASTPPREPEPEPIQLTFVEPPPANTAPQGPTYFTELPEDREDLAPERADFLSNVTSRARDQVSGGDQSLPRMSGENDAPSVAMESGPVERKPADTPAQREGPQQPESAVPGATTPAVPREFGRSSSIFRDEPTTPGNSDIRQGEMDNPDGNAEMTGGVSLNTVEWEWAPWVKRFSRKLMRVWIAPPAYSFGVLKEGGWTVVEIEVARSGEVLRMDVLEEQGHPSLSNASMIALRSTAPMEPLPANFPENTLVMRLRLVYPKIRPR